MRLLALTFKLSTTLQISSTLKLSLAAPLCLFAARAARAQDLDEVSFAGTVVDVNGAVVQGASVTATLANTNSPRTVVTDAEGRYRLVELRPGAYTLRVEAAGFAADVRADVHTLAGQSVRLDFVFTLGGLTEEPLSELYFRILYVYETKAGVYAGDERVHTEKLYVHVRHGWTPI